MKKLHVTVTAEHIANGLKWDCRLCPIALAFKDAGYPLTDVRARSAYPRGRFQGGGIKLPIFARDFIRMFDSGGNVKPFEFDIDWPDDASIRST